MSLVTHINLHIEQDLVNQNSEQILMNKKGIFAVLIGVIITIIPFLLLLPILNHNPVINYINGVINDFQHYG